MPTATALAEAKRLPGSYSTSATIRTTTEHTKRKRMFEVRLDIVCLHHCTGRINEAVSFVGDPVARTTQLRNSANHEENPFGMASAHLLGKSFSSSVSVRRRQRARRSCPTPRGPPRCRLCPRRYSVAQERLCHRTF